MDLKTFLRTSYKGMYSSNSLNLPSFPNTTMSNNLTQEDVDRVMTKGKVRFLLPKFLLQLRSVLGPWTFKSAHVNDFFESGNTGS